MSQDQTPKGTLWITTHRFVFQCSNNKSSPYGLFEVPLEIFVKESYFGGFFQSGHRVKIKRDGEKQSNVYDSSTLEVMIQNVASSKAEELKVDPSMIEEEYRGKLANRSLPSKLTFFCSSKNSKNKIKKHVDEAVNREDWTKVKFDINKYIRQSDMGIGNIMGRQKEKDSVMASKIAMTAADINHLSSNAQDLISMADEIKNRLARFKDSFSSYQEHKEIMDMIFELGMNNDQDEVFVQESMKNLSKKDFEKKIVKDLIEFLDNNIKGYGGWIPCAELYCKFNRRMGLDLISPEEFVRACTGLEKFNCDDGTSYIYDRTFIAKNGESVAMVTHPDFSIKRKASELGKKLKKKGGVGLTQNDIVKSIKMNYVIVEQVINRAIDKSKVVVDEQDPAGKRYYFNKISEYNISDIEI